MATAKKSAPKKKASAPRKRATQATRRRARAGWQPQFLDAFRTTGLVKDAAEVANVSRQHVYRERENNEEFAAAWEEIEQEVTESMERELYRRAVEGVEEPLVSAGKLVTNVRRFSDQLLMFGLKARDPGKYRERVDVQHSGRVSGKVEFIAPDADEKRQGVAQILHEAGALNGNGNA